MSLSLNKKLDQPLYRQIKDHILDRINNGEWVEGSKLPSENDFVAGFQISRMTVNRALRELSQEGVLSRVHGLGTFVAEKTRHASLIKLQDIAEEVVNIGKQYRCKILAQVMVKSDNKIAKKCR